MRSRARSPHSCAGNPFRRRVAASSSGCTATRCASTKSALGLLVTLETGKLLQEGLGEVQEMIDICDFAVGLSRQLHGLTIASERPDHRMLETWHPLRGVRRDLGVQFSGRGVGLERGTRARVRQRGRVEAVGEDAADRVGGARADAADARDVRCVVRRRRSIGHRRPRDRREARRAPGCRARERDGVDRDGTRRRRGMRATVQANASWSSAATTRPSSRRAPTRISPRARSCSPRSARPASDARRCAGCSCTSRGTRISLRA